VTISTVSDAAAALRPLAGRGAELLFALGVVGAGLLAVPVLAGSSAYALAESYRWKSGLDSKPSSAPAFYSVIALGIAFGVVADLLHVDAIGMLFWSAVVNGFVAVPLLIGIVITGNHSVMGRWRNGRNSNVWMVLTIVLMAAAAVGFVVTA
jgi:Mn2+/Fe2+ NRAMP family transporter